MRLKQRYIFNLCVVIGTYSCWIIFQYMSGALTSGANGRQPIITKTVSEAMAALKTVHIYPVLGNTEAPGNIDFNIDRWFSINGVADSSQTIPKIIHFIWSNETVPSQFINNLKSFPVNNEGWQYYFWTIKDGRSLIQKHHPELVQTYDNYKQDVMRADVLRYVVMYHFGGAYFDLDTSSLKPLDTVIVGEQCVVSPEPMEHAVFVLNMRSLLSNAVFLCSPKHTFFKFLIDGLQEASSENHEQLISGPIYFTRIFNNYIKYYSELGRNRAVSETIHVVSCTVFLDRIKDNVHTILKEECPRLDQRKKLLYDVFSCHQQTNTHALKFCGMLYKYRMYVEACERWSVRGGSERVMSQRAVNDHEYYGSYTRPQSIKYSRENHIKYVIPQVKLYTYIS